MHLITATYIIRHEISPRISVDFDIKKKNNNNNNNNKK